MSMLSVDKVGEQTPKQLYPMKELDSSIEELNSLDNRVVEKKPLIKNIRNYFREYCQCTGVHGFRYFGEKRTHIERVWWFMVFVVCLTALSISIQQVYNKWDNAPVIVTFATKATPIYEIPFPAVTICPEAKSMQTSYNYSDIVTRILDKKKLTPEESKIFNYMSLICPRIPRYEYMSNITFGDEFFEVLEKVKPKFLAWRCSFMGEQQDCDSLFLPIMTDEGICYTFNTFDRSEIFQDTVYHYKNYHSHGKRSTDWSTEHGYRQNASIDTYPKRALLAGAKYALQLDIVTPEENLDFGCKSSQGYRVILHMPSRLPRPSQEYFRVPLDHTVIAAVQPIMMDTSDSVKMYSSKKRECYFPSERHLQYFKVYTALNCQMECLTNYTINTIECVNFYMPSQFLLPLTVCRGYLFSNENHFYSTSGEKSTPICGTGKFDRMRNIEKDAEEQYLANNLGKDYADRKENCDCLPLCKDLTYHTETSQAEWDWMSHIKTFDMVDELKKLYNYTNETTVHMSSLTIFFKSKNFIPSERNVLYGPTDFLANFGGLLGLFTGFSVLSLMEIIYFLTVRICCNKKLYGHWAGPEK